MSFVLFVFLGRRGSRRRFSIFFIFSITRGITRRSRFFIWIGEFVFVAVFLRARLRVRVLYERWVLVFYL